MYSLFHYIRRSCQLGLVGSLRFGYEKITNKLFEQRWRKKAAQKLASFSWELIQQRHQTDRSTTDLLTNLHTSAFPSIDELFVDQALLNNIDDLLKNRFALLGSKKESYFAYPWHEDFRFKQLDSRAVCSYDPTLFYKDIVVEPGLSQRLTKDIKVPWELGRLHHCAELAHAFSQTGDVRYKDKAWDIFLDWHKKNPFLLGVNWVCPMDVGIRAVNLVWLLQLAPDTDSYQQLIESIYDHLFYLENNWEVYDGITSNHYLADLIGYLYCCWVFQSLLGFEEKIDWVFNELIKEFDKQVFDEGTDYEGSTSYHKMVTEFFYHAYLMADALNYDLPPSFELKLKRMFQFIAHTTFDNGEQIQIGDTDSGRLLFGISHELVEKMSVKHDHDFYRKDYKKFGVSIIKNNHFHVSLRHHAYQKPQPSGHYHVDVGSITLAVNGIPLFIDPGSYLYTPSAVWRNQFRFHEMHSTFYKKNESPIALDNQLFYLNMQEVACKEVGRERVVQTHHDLYPERAHRAASVEEDRIVISDWWDTKESIKTEWRFILHPAITVQELDGHRILFLNNDQRLVYFESEVAFSIQDSWYSSGYGHKEKTIALVGSQHISSGVKAQFVLQVN